MSAYPLCVRINDDLIDVQSPLELQALTKELASLEGIGLREATRRVNVLRLETDAPQPTFSTQGAGIALCWHCMRG